MSSALEYHLRYSATELDAQYNLARRRPDYMQSVIPVWMQRSERARDELDCHLDVRYGAGAKQCLDIFHCGDTHAPCLLYFHGGYWQRGDKSVYSFVAPAFVGHKVNVVVVGYDLCPDVSLTQIVNEAREAVYELWVRASEFGLNRERFAVMGHSAGGHLALMLMGTKWADQDPRLPAEIIKLAIPISPLSWLEPVRLTEELNAAIGMDESEAHALSPMTHHAPVTRAPQLVFVGQSESSEFHRQADMYASAYGDKHRDIRVSKLAGADHFDVLNAVVDAESFAFQASLQLLHDC